MSREFNTILRPESMQKAGESFATERLSGFVYPYCIRKLRRICYPSLLSSVRRTTHVSFFSGLRYRSA